MEKNSIKFDHEYIVKTINKFEDNFQSRGL
jgi:hypothetical protein